MNGMFANCSSLKYIDLSNFITSNNIDRFNFLDITKECLIKYKVPNILKKIKIFIILI